MENKQFIGMEMLETSWIFIKHKLKKIDTWFFLTFISFFAQIGIWLLFVLVGVLTFISFFSNVAIVDVIFKADFMLTLPKVLQYIVLFLIFGGLLFFCYKLLKKTLGFWNLVALNSLDAALDRPMRKFEGLDDRLSFIVLFMLLGFLTVLGLCLLIVPGIFFMIRASMAYPIMLEEKCSPLQAISKSIDMTRGNFWPIFISFCVFSFLFWIPFVNLINMFIPFTSWNIASIYAQLKKQ